MGFLCIVPASNHINPDLSSQKLLNWWSKASNGSEKARAEADLSRVVSQFAAAELPGSAIPARAMSLQLDRQYLKFLCHGCR
jgi:hypothetical protein